MAYKRSAEPHRYSVSLVTQGNHRFYTLTMPSEVLANTCYVTTRDEDPQKGFQRVLDQKRAQGCAASATLMVILFVLSGDLCCQRTQAGRIRLNDVHG
jgi:hypothetical protein